jgi:hypothetical protein
VDKGKKLFIAAICLIVIAMGALIISIIIFQLPSFVPPLTVQGDVSELLTIRDVQEVAEPEKTTIDGTLYKTIKLTEVINKVKPTGTVKQIFFVASDGFTAAIDADNLDTSYIAFSKDNGWLALNPNHPLNANVKMVQKIIFVCDADSSQNSLTVIKGKNVLNTTVGKLYAGTFTSYPYFEGQATIEHDATTYKSDIYTRRRVFKLSDLVFLDKGAQITLLGENGDYKLVDNSGYYQLCGNYLNYIQPKTREKMEKVKIAVINQPSANITDAYYDSIHYLINDENVLIVILNGFSYGDYEDAIKNGDAPFLKENTVATKSMGFYPLTVNAWLASMLTGFSPAETKVLNTDDKDLTIDTIFSEATTLGKKAILLEADSLLNIDGAKIVNDDNSSGTTDDELYKNLLKSISDADGLTVVRFDAIGKNSISFGKESSQYKNSISQIDNYINKTAKSWQGKIIVTALPNSSNNSVLAENLFVPYLILSGEN